MNSHWYNVEISTYLRCSAPLWNEMHYSSFISLFKIKGVSGGCVPLSALLVNTVIS